MGENIYEFIVDGALSGRACAAFPELRVLVSEQHTTTRLIGAVAGRGGLRAILRCIDELGLVLTGMRRLPG